MLQVITLAWKVFKEGDSHARLLCVRENPGKTSIIHSTTVTRPVSDTLLLPLC